LEFWKFAVIAVGVALAPLASAHPRLATRAHWQIDAAGTGGAPGSHASVLALSYRGVVVCTGALIAPRVVLTARHCVGVERASVGVDGAHPVATRAVIDHQSAQSGIDAAVLLLDAPLELEPLPLRSQRDVTPPSGVRIVGYGHENVRQAGVRRYLEAHAPGWGCTYGDRALYGCAPDFELVLPRKSGADTCHGDSGGPVLEREGQRWRIVAITSRSVVSSILECGDGGVYVRVDSIRPWLDRAIARLGSRKETSR